MSADNNQYTQFDIEKLTQTEWVNEHQRKRAELGEAAYLKLRKSEINTKMQDIFARLHSGQLQLPIKEQQEPDRIALPDGRQFYIGPSHGVPDAVSEILHSHQGQTAADLPPECLKFEIPRETLDNEERERDMTMQEREKAQDEKILSGEFSTPGSEMDWKFSRELAERQFDIFIALREGAGPAGQYSRVSKATVATETTSVMLSHCPSVL
ncbi:hypothetical protein KCU81_g9854, partial [Aureobasidium melanogenum]|uniref:Uncharacterized protein n=1 Tax=Aureobasidium melanogenum (strain CBS 110374) TaxID=1043003 RepID=A0A074VBJ5_AURM1